MGILKLVGIDFIIKFIVTLVGEYLLRPASGAKYLKWFITLRNYLLLLVPIELYPIEENTIPEALRSESARMQLAIPFEAAEAAAKEHGFKLPKMNRK